MTLKYDRETKDLLILLENVIDYFEQENEHAPPFEKRLKKIERLVRELHKDVRRS